MARKKPGPVGQPFGVNRKPGNIRQRILNRRKATTVAGGGTPSTPPKVKSKTSTKPEK